MTVTVSLITATVNLSDTFRQKPAHIPLYTSHQTPYTLIKNEFGLPKYNQNSRGHQLHAR